MKYLNLMLIPLVLALSGCLKLPDDHVHTTYEYGIKYGKDKNNLSELLTRSCTAFYHEGLSIATCPPTISIDGYVCALDGYLYLSTTSNKSSSTTSLKDVHCENVILSKEEATYRYERGLFHYKEYKIN